MSLTEFAAARQVLVEERIGTALRDEQRAEDRAAARTKAVLQRQERARTPKVHGETA